MSPPRSILLSDLHLNLRGERDCAGALERLVREHPNAELLFVGDVFEFSSLMPLPSPALAWESMRAANPRFYAAVETHLAGAGTVTFVCGNHDAVLSELEGTLRRAWCPAAPKKLHVNRWFTLRGATYIEHGHLYDRDNAPLHPLADWSQETEPVGIALMRRFVAAQGAFDFAHAHRITPVEAVRKAFAEYGVKTPWVAASYFATAAALCAESAVPRKAQLAQDKRQGSERLGKQAEAERVSPQLLSKILEGAPTPTHASAAAVFQRLYFDRVAATALASLGASLSLRSRALGSALLGTAALLMAASRKGGKTRSSDPVHVLAEAATHIRDVLGVETVVFGHTHVEADTPHYINLGSFEYGGKHGRPCLFLDEQGRPTRHHVKDGAG